MTGSGCSRNSGGSIFSRFSSSSIVSRVARSPLQCPLVSRRLPTRSCSDAAIAPLVTAQRTRLSGLTLATNSLTITTDIRGNENIVRNILDPAILSSCRIADIRSQMHSFMGCQSERTVPLFGWKMRQFRPDDLALPSLRPSGAIAFVVGAVGKSGGSLASISIAITVSRCWGRALSCEPIPIIRSRLSCSRK